MKKKRLILIGVLAAILLPLLIWSIIENENLQLATVTVKASNLPESFDGFRIAHVSDLHNAEIGQGNEDLLAMLENAAPDLIAITGDLVDSRSTDVAVAVDFCKKAVEIAPVYYVTGNHEVRLETQLYSALLLGLREAGVRVMEDEEDILTVEDSSISVVGHQWGDTSNIGAISNFDGFKILLSHHPENVEDYAAGGYDLVLSGHAHGGQFRLPWIGGLFAPGQGFLPQYDSGLYQVGNTQMIVSRGIGNSLVPLRFNNPPEVVLVILEA